MKRSNRTSRQQALIQELGLAVHGIRAPFACGGTLLPELPVTLRFKDKTQLPVLRSGAVHEQQRLFQPLVSRCTPASFGAGRKTRYDRNVRDGLQLKAESGAFSVRNFDPASAGVLEQVRRELLPQVQGSLEAELYSVNVYASGGHFEPHKDTPRGSDMLGTLVVCLPSQFSNGMLVVKHRGVFQIFDWAGAISKQAEPARIHWAAFFGDVDHQIERVWSGLRVTLTYLLRSCSSITASPVQDSSSETPESLVQTKLRQLLQDRRFLPEGGTLAVPCSHLYHQDARFQRKQRALSRRTISSLKGRDHAVASAALAEELEIALCPYMVETCADETWRLEHFPTSGEKSRLRGQMDPTDLEDALAIEESFEGPLDLDVIWVDRPPQFNEAPTMYPGFSEGKPRPPDPELPAIALLHSCEYSATGYFGNEGSEIDLYVYAALHLRIPPYGQGVRSETGRVPVEAVRRHGR